MDLRRKLLIALVVTLAAALVGVVVGAFAGERLRRGLGASVATRNRYGG